MFAFSSLAKNTFIINRVTFSLSLRAISLLQAWRLLHFLSIFFLEFFWSVHFWTIAGNSHINVCVDLRILPVKSTLTQCGKIKLPKASRWEVCYILD